MATTPRFGMYLPVETDLCNADLILNPQLQTIDDNWDCVSVLALPSTGYEGQMVYHQNEKAVYVRQNFSWHLMTGVSRAWGKELYVETTTQSGQIPENNELVVMWGIFMQATQRVYRVSYSVHVAQVGVQPGPVNNIEVRVRYRLGNLGVGNSDPLIYMQYADQYIIDTPTVGVPQLHQGEFSYTSNFTGYISFGVFLYRGDDSANVAIRMPSDYLSNFVIEDIGPAA